MQITNRQWGIALLRLVLILGGGVLALDLKFNYINIILGFMAIIAGILIWAGR